MAKPKLELQCNIPQLIKLLQTEPYIGNNSYGVWYLYNVLCDGIEFSFFPPEKVVKIFKENDLKEGDEIVLTKKLVKKGNKNVFDYEVNVVENKLSENGNLNHNGHKNNNGNDGIGNNHSQNSNLNGNMSKDFPVMLQSMKEALMVRDEIGIDVDVNKIAITLFLRKTKS